MPERRDVLAVRRKPRVVVLRALGLGDFLTAVPALRAVAAALPGHVLELLAPKALSPLAPLTGVVDVVRDTPALPAPGDASGPPPDVAVNLHGRGPESHRFLEALSPRALVAFRGPGTPHGPAWEDDEHETERWTRLIREALGGGAPADALRIARPEGRPTWPAGTAVVHPGAAFGARRWPADRFAAVAAYLEASGRRVVVSGLRSERRLAEEVAAGAGLPRARVLAGRTNTGDLARLVSDSAVLISGDTGIAHLASALGTPSVVLFGPVSPRRWGPPPGGPHVALWSGTDGDPHAPAADPGLLRITVGDVLEALEVLASTSRPKVNGTPPHLDSCSLL